MGELSGLAELWLVHGEWGLGGELSRERLNPWLLTEKLSLVSSSGSRKSSVLEEARQGHPVWQSLSPWKSQNTGGETLNVRATVSTCPNLFYHRLRDEKGKWLVPHPLVSHGKIRWKHGSLITTPSPLRKSHPLSYHTHTNMHTFEALNLQS